MSYDSEREDMEDMADEDRDIVFITNIFIKTLLQLNPRFIC